MKVIQAEPPLGILLDRDGVDGRVLVLSLMRGAGVGVAKVFAVYSYFLCGSVLVAYMVRPKQVLLKRLLQILLKGSLFVAACLGLLLCFSMFQAIKESSGSSLEAALVFMTTCGATSFAMFQVASLIESVSGS